MLQTEEGEKRIVRKEKTETKLQRRSGESSETSKGEM